MATELIVELIPEELPLQPSLDPITLTPWQLLRTLNTLGWRESVELAVAAADQDTKDGWNKATSFEETHPLVVALAAAIGKTTEDCHNLFLLGASYDV